MHIYCLMFKTFIFSPLIFMVTWYRLLGCCVWLFLAFSYIPQVASGDGDPACDPGQTYSWGLASCVDCEPGRYNSTGIGACLPCEIGTFQADAWSRTCNLCEPGTFTDFTQSISCSPCPAGWDSNAWANACFKTTGRSSSITEGKFLTEWNKDTDSDNTPDGDSEKDDNAPLTSYALSDEEKNLVSNVIDKIKILMQLNRASDSVYEKTITLLEGYLSEFASQGDAKKIAIAEELLSLLKSLFGK